jgi:type II secretory pathway component GspD/PulD (secretin)
MPAHHHQRRTSALPVIFFICAFFAASVFAAHPQTSTRSDDSSAGAATVKPNARKAKEAFEAGKTAEQKQDWATAFDSYSQAVEFAPKIHDYAVKREVARGAVVQMHLSAAERDAISNRLADARAELVRALDVDPTNAVVRERLAEYMATQAPAPAVGSELEGVPQLDYQKGTHSFDYRGDTRGAYEQIARAYGVEDAFDPQLPTRPVQLRLADVDFTSVMRILGDMTGTFWRPLTSRMFFVAEDTPQKRRDFGASAVRTVLLPASESNEQMTETLRVVRDLTGITRATLDTGAHTITLRASPQSLAVASNLIDGIEQKLGEMVLEVEVLEVDRNYARQLGITPPEHTQAYTLSPSQIAQANQSASNLISIISQVFGLPTSLAGLSPTQIAGLLASGNLNEGSLLPPLVAFGGGESTFLATLPGASVSYSRMLSLVRHGQRIFLRCEDGQPATAFVGEQFPVSLASYSSSLGGTNIPGISSSNFPTKNYDAGNGPQFVATTPLRAKSTINDLIVANQTSGNIGVLIGNGTTTGDGTFANQVTYATDPANPLSGPVWIATGEFDESAGFTDIAVANKASNNVGILLASTAGDGTFQAAKTIPTGTAPVSLIAGRFHDATGANHIDLAVANQGDNSISIFTGNGDGTFATAATVLQLPSGYSPAGMATADVNADGHTDLIVADQGNNTVSVFLSNGDGTFQPRVDYPVGNSPVSVAVDDLNADGILDLAIANNGAPTENNSGDSVTILLGQKNATSGIATGTFAPGSTRDFPAGAAPTSLVIGDFNLDGLPDIVVSDGNNAATATAGDNAISVLIGGGDGSFSSNFELPVGTNPQSLVTADFNDDAKPDIATANFGSNNVTVILDSSSVFSGSGPNGSIGTPFPNVQYIDLGIKMKATPRIHADDVTLALDLTINSLSSQSFNSIPALNNETLTHTVRLRQDQTSVIASFLAPSNTTNVAGTPGAVGLPGLEWLAQTQNVANQDTEIVILVTPRMVRYAERENREIYAGQGALEGTGVAPPGQVFNPVQPPAAGPASEQPGAPTPGGPVAAPGQVPVQGPGGGPPEQAPGQQTPNQPAPPGQQPTDQQPAPSQPPPQMPIDQTAPTPGPPARPVIP